jgi:hypothetical protein
MSATAHESPFVTVWEAPRETIRRVVRDDPARHVNALLFAVGAAGFVESVTSTPPSSDWSPVTLAAAAAAIGVVSLGVGRLSAAYLRWVGALLGGVASRAEVLAAYVWSSVPSVAVALLVALVRFGVFGRAILGTEQSAATAAAPLLARTLWLAAMLGGLWSGVLGLVCYAEVNRFSIARAFAAELLAAAIGLLVVGGPLLVYALRLASAAA